MKTIIIVIFGLLLPILVASQTNRQTFTVGPAIVPPGEMLMGAINNAPRPSVSGNMSVSFIEFALVDINNNRIPIEDVYLHHLYLYYTLNNETIWFAAIGAESQQDNITIPSPYGIVIPGGAEWTIGYDLINSWGKAACANISVYMQYTIGWSTPVAATKSVFFVLFDVTNGNTTFNVPGNGGPGSIYTRNFTWDWGQFVPASVEIVFLIAHLHIGSVNITFADVTGGQNKVFCSAKSIYNVNEYVVSLGNCMPSYVFKVGGKYELVANYDNSKAYAQVMAMWIGYAYYMG